MSPALRAALLTQAAKALRAAWAVQPQPVEVSGFGRGAQLLVRLEWCLLEPAPALLVQALGDATLPAALDKLRDPNNPACVSGDPVYELMRTGWHVHHARWVPQVIRFGFVCGATRSEFLARMDSASDPEGDIQLTVRVFDTEAFDLQARSMPGEPFKLDMSGIAPAAAMPHQRH